MSKFHITKAGRTEPCGATKRACPLGEANHYENANEAALAVMNRGFIEEQPKERFVKLIDLTLQQQSELKTNADSIAEGALSGRYVDDSDDVIRDDLSGYLYDRAEEWASFDANSPEDSYEPIIEDYFNSERYESALDFAEEARHEAELDDEEYLREEAAKSRSTPVVVDYVLTDEQRELVEQATDEDEGVRAEVAENPNTPVEVLEKFANDKYEDEIVHYAVAGNPNAPASALEKLASKSAFGGMHEIVAANPNTPTAVLEKLVEDEEWVWRDQEFDVRRSVAQHSNTSEGVLEQLASTEDREVRAAIAANSNTPISVVEKLASDKDPVVREAVKGRVQQDDNLPVEQSMFITALAESHDE